MALPLAALAAPAILGKLAKGASTALTAGKFLDAAIPGKSEKALRQVGKEARDRLSKGQYGLSKAEKEQEVSRRMGDVARRATAGVGDNIRGKAMQQLVQQLTAQRGSVGTGVAKASRQMGRAQQTADIKAVSDLAKDTQARTSAIVGQLPEEQKKKGLASYGLEGFASMANKPKEDEEIMGAISSAETSARRTI